MRRDRPQPLALSGVPAELVGSSPRRARRLGSGDRRPGPDWHADAEWRPQIRELRRARELLTSRPWRPSRPSWLVLLCFSPHVVARIRDRSPRNRPLPSPLRYRFWSRRSGPSQSSSRSSRRAYRHQALPIRIEAQNSRRRSRHSTRRSRNSVWRMTCQASSLAS